MAGIYFIFLKNRPGPNLKVFQCLIWTSVKRLGKELSIKTKFNTRTLLIITRRFICREKKIW